MKKELLEQYRSFHKSSENDRDLKSCVNRYLQNKAVMDESFRLKFIPSKMDSCIRFITDNARSLLEGKSGDVSDDLCYKMAMDYFNDEIWKEEEAEAEAEAEEKARSDEKSKVDIESLKQKVASIPVPTSPKKKFEPCSGQLDLFGGM